MALVALHTSSNPQFLRFVESLLFWRFCNCELLIGYENDRTLYARAGTRGLGDEASPLVVIARNAGDSTRRAESLTAESIAAERWADATVVAISIDLGWFGGL